MTISGLLPKGIYDCSLDEVRVRFGSFQSSDRRCRLFEKLEAFVHEARTAGFIVELILDGSFVSDIALPNDVDLILGLSPAHEFEAELRPFEYNVVSRRQVRRHWGIDVLVAAVASPAYDEYIGFFQQVRGDPDRRKGVLRVRL